jgi:hypothetical protein
MRGIALGKEMERLDQDIHVALVITNLSNIDHPRSPAGMESLFDRPEAGYHPTCSVVSDRNP